MMRIVRDDIEQLRREIHAARSELADIRRRTGKLADYYAELSERLYKLGGDDELSRVLAEIASRRTA